MNDTITIDGIEYVRKEQRKGNRYFVCVDRGWLFAGNVSDENGRIIIRDAVNVFRWEEIGFTKVLENPDSPKVDIRPLPDSASCVDLPADAEVFRVPVPEGWGK